MSSNNYKMAIQIISGIESLDLAKIAVDYAQKHPADFCRIASRDNSKWFIECKELALTGRKIDAIKLWRVNTGDGLKEAKEAVESL